MAAPEQGHARAYCLPPAALSGPAASSVQPGQENQTDTPAPFARLQQCNELLEGSQGKLCDTAACIGITFPTAATPASQHCCSKQHEVLLESAARQEAPNRDAMTRQSGQQTSAPAAPASWQCCVRVNGAPDGHQLAEP